MCVCVCVAHRRKTTFYQNMQHHFLLSCLLVIVRNVCGATCIPCRHTRLFHRLQTDQAVLVLLRLDSPAKCFKQQSSLKKERFHFVFECTAAALCFLHCDVRCTPSFFPSSSSSSTLNSGMAAPHRAAFHTRGNMADQQAFLTDSK